MRIAQIAPLHEAVPPRLYGGTERVVSGRTKAHELERLLPWRWKAKRPAATVHA